MNQVLFLGILLLLGLMSTRIVKQVKLPNVTGYLIIGLLVAVLCIVIDTLTGTKTLTESLNTLNSFVSDVALGFIALSIGEEFKLAKLKQYGMKIISITLLQAFGAVILVDVGLVIFCLLTNQSLAATIMVINQYKAKGPLVDILLPVVAFDDAVGLIVFAISVAVSKVIVTGSPITFMSVCVMPLLEILGSLLLGFVLGLIMHFIVRIFKSRDNHAITLIAFTLLGVGGCEALSQIVIDGQALEFSNLLCCMMIGAAYVNLSKDQQEKEIVDRDFGLISHWTPFLFMLFFVLSGCHLATAAEEIFMNQSSSSISIWIVVVALALYLVLRSSGKYFGAFIGCKATKRQKTITHYLGITLLPQAGVAIGMANQISDMAAFKEGGIGSAIVTVVLCATLIYELVGPLLTKWALEKSGEIPDENGVYPCEANPDPITLNEKK